MSLVKITGKLIHSQEDTWGVTKALTIGQGKLLLRIGAVHGAIGARTTEGLWKVGPNRDHRIDYGRDLYESRLWYESARRLVMTRVSRGQQDSFLLCWSWSPSITVRSGSTTHRGELVSTGEGHPNLPSGFRDSLMAWET